MKDPMKIHPISSQNCSRGGVGSCRGGMCHVGVGWGVSCRGGVGHVRVGWGGSCRGGGGSCRGGVGCVMWGGEVGHTRVGWVIVG